MRPEKTKLVQSKNLSGKGGLNLIMKRRLVTKEILRNTYDFSSDFSDFKLAAAAQQRCRALRMMITLRLYVRLSVCPSVPIANKIQNWPKRTFWDISAIFGLKSSAQPY